MTHLTRIPAAPLLRQVELHGGRAHLGLNERTAASRAFDRARREGSLTLDAADQLAVLVLGMHPIEIWGDTYLGEVQPA